jgi:hypothetical protein
MKASDFEQPKQEKANPKPGSHVGILYQIIDYGRQDVTYEGKTKTGKKSKICI